MAHEVRSEQVQRSRHPSPDIGVWDGYGILRPVPVVERQLGVNLSQQLLQAVDDLTMPRQELWSAVHMRRLMNLVLLEPPGHPAGNSVCSTAGKPPVVQLHESVAKQCPLNRINMRNIPTYSISEGHKNYLRFSC
jgi:hypothetical protein